MTWIKLDDKTPRHPKIAGLSDKAKWVWLGSLCYASEFLTDGLLPAAYLVTVPKKLRDEIIAAGLWLNVSGVVSIHGYLEHQTSKAEVEKERKRNRDRRKTDGGTTGTTDGTTGVKPEPDVDSTDQSSQKDTDTYGAAGASRFPQAVENSGKASDWKRAIAITHGVIEANPKNAHDWQEEVKTKLQEQHIDPRQRGPRGGQLFAEVVEYVIEVRRRRAS